MSYFHGVKYQIAPALHMGANLLNHPSGDLKPAQHAPQGAEHLFNHSRYQNPQGIPRAHRRRWGLNRPLVHPDNELAGVPTL